MGLGGKRTTTQLLAAALLLLLCVSVQLQGACGAAAEGEIGEGGACGACGAAAEGEIGKGGGGSRPYTGSGSYSSDSVETSSPGAFIIALALDLGTHLDWLPYIYIPRVKYITSLVACLCIFQLVDHMSVQLRTHKVYFNLTLLCVCAHLQEGCCEGVGERGGGESRHRGSCPYSSGGAGGRDPLGDSGALRVSDAAAAATCILWYSSLCGDYLE